MAVVVRRGIYLDLDKTKLLPGELCITTDTGQCFFCYAPGNVKELATKKDLQEILTESPEAYNALQKLLEDLENNKDELTNILNDILSLKENKLDVTGDSCNNTVTFEEANNDEDIVSGETHAKIFGKILKSFKALRQGKINTTNIVQTDAVNEQTKVPSSAVTYAHGQLISQLQSNITALNNNLAYTLKLIGKTPGDADLNATPFTVDLAHRGSWLVSVASETTGIASNGLYIISVNSDKALITPILQNNNIDVSYNGGTLTVKALDTAPYKWGFVSVYRLW